MKITPVIEQASTVYKGKITENPNVCSQTPSVTTYRHTCTDISYTDTSPNPNYHCLFEDVIIILHVQIYIELQHISVYMGLCLYVFCASSYSIPCIITIIYANTVMLRLRI